VAALAGCASAVGIEGGVYRSAKGYTVTVPGPAWKAVTNGRADLELLQNEAGAGMVINASCDTGTSRRSLDVLRRHLLFGLRERVIEQEDTEPLDGREASHAVIEGRLGEAGDRMRVELYVMKDTRCVFDLLYTAPPDRFEQLRPDFRKLVDSFSAR
jgi:hypothetical protein